MVAGNVFVPRDHFLDVDPDGVRAGDFVLSGVSDAGDGSFCVCDGDRGSLRAEHGNPTSDVFALSGQR